MCLLYWRTQSIIPCMALHALNNSITFGVVEDLDPALFAGVVVLSVGTVVAGATAVVRASAGRRMRRAGLALALRARTSRLASAQTPPARRRRPSRRRPRRRPSAAKLASPLGRLDAPAALTGRSFTARVVMKPFVAGETAIAAGLPRQQEDPVKALTLKPVAGGAAGVATLKVKSQAAAGCGQASHKGDARCSRPLRAKSVRVTVVRPSAGPGSSGPGGAPAAGQARGDALRRAAHAASMTPAPAAR